uniref:RNA polymerase II associated protein 1 n=1 Tax=Esox lucius TaxID=8010 RepID=A0A6Q2XLH2_ESOLU
MIKRPKPTDSEADILREQEKFLASGSPSTVNVVRRPDKRAGQSGETLHVSLDLPDDLPTLTPAPPKKSRLKGERVRFEDEDPEELLDRHDTHISAVLSKIIVRDTHNCLLSRATRRSVPTNGRKRSIFARQTAAQMITEEKTQCAPGWMGPTSGPGVLNLSPECCVEVEAPPSRLDSKLPDAMAGPRLVSGQGLGGPGGTAETLQIHQENQAKIQAMSKDQILEEQQRLLVQLDPRLVDFVRSRKAAGGSAPNTFQNVLIGVLKMHCSPEEDLPIKPQKDWVHMDKLEPEKLEWIRDLPAPRRKGTKMAMQARFDFAGTLIPPTEDLPTHLGLHHHGDEPELAGYSLQELFLLSRSQLIQQRSLALSTLAHVLTKARAGEFAAALKGSVVSTLLDAGLLFLLRFSLDDSVEGVMSAAVQALRALLVSPGDEECLDATLSWLHGLASFPLLPTAEEEEDEEDEGLPEVMRETAEEKEEKKTDHDVARHDVVKGVLRMKLLPRLRYILEVVRPSPKVVQDVLAVLIRVARHSSSAATQVLDCPRLMETVMSEFVPCSWTVPASPNAQPVYGVPVADAVKLLRVLASAGRHVCARLLNSLGARECLSRLLAPEPAELQLEPGEALRVSTEAYWLWAVAASYGQACSLYVDLYPVLVKALQSAPWPRSPSDPLLSLELRRHQALLTLLTHVTHTAGGAFSAPTSQGAECPPPPPVTWGHVMGLQPAVLGLLKGCIRTLGDPVQRESTLRLVPSYLLYLGAFYSQLSLQRSFSPVACLQELEKLTAEVLLPLLSHEAVHSLINNLQSCSAVCNPQSCSPSPETVPSLPGLGCSQWISGGLAGTSSPFPLVTSLCYLLDTLISLHKGLVPVCTECFQVPSDPEVAVHATLFHHTSLVMLPWLLPGSEFLAHELMSTMVFNKDFMPEGQSGGPEAAELSELQLQDRPSPSLQTLGPLLREACVQLPSIRGCYLFHLAHMEPAVLSSQDYHLGRTPWINTQLLPGLTGPSLPSDWPFLPLVSLYERAGAPDGGGQQVESLPAGSVQSVTFCLQWLLLLEVWREEALRVVLPVAKLARLACVFLSSSDLFLERPVQRLTWALFRLLTRPSRLDALDVNSPPPGLASFDDLYSALLGQFEAVSFGDHLFGCFVLLPLQRRYSATMRLKLFGEHAGLLRSLGVTLEQLAIPIERFTSPPEDSLPLLRLYFRTLVTGALRQCWCPVLYVVALSHLNTFIFSQDAGPQVPAGLCVWTMIVLAFMHARWSSVFPPV